MHSGVMSRQKQMDKKIPSQTISIFGYDNRRNTSTIRSWSQQEKKGKKKIHYDITGTFEYGINFIRISILIFTNIYITYLKI